MIKAIVFDYGGVIGTNTTPLTLENMAKKSGLPIETVKVEYHKLRSGLQKGKISMEMFWIKYGEAINLDPNIVEEIWVTTFEKMSKVNLEVKEIIQLLKNGGYKIVLCTNTEPSNSEVHKKKGDYNIFSVQVISCEVGMRKPDREMYEYVLKQLNVRAEECIFIDDKPANVEAAKNIGMKGILFENAKQLREELRKCGVHGL